MQIGPIPLEGLASLAPMAGVTDATMRALCARYGSAFTVSEMVSAKALTMKDKKSRRLLLGNTTTVPYGVQLFGNEPEVLAEAIPLIEDIPYDFLDLNMGCPAPKIACHGSGSGLLKNPVLAGEFAKAATRASNRPVTVKLRIGWDDATLTGLEVAKRCEDAGVVLLAVHARTREEMYTPGVHYDQVAKIKQAVSIPVIYNGDVEDASSALYALSQTGCDGVMIGRAAMGAPWVFRQVDAALKGLPLPPPPPLAEKMKLLDEQVEGMCKEKGEEVAMRQARGVAGSYVRGLNGAAALRREAYTLTYYTDLARFIEEVYRYNS